MHTQKSFKLLLWSCLAFASLQNHIGLCRVEKCSGISNAPTLTQTQVELGNPPKYKAQVQNKCPMCPIINIHLECGNFSQALVNPRFLKVISSNDCVVNSGLPLAPLQIFSFNYSHNKYAMHLTTWSFQCE
ncbi:hypothetical protein Pint_25566 [Pistacia integerrima]|uniref:Uncharacterized protein n=1 Tax=Pistacia integerrima TaxID=434235 RepID=A0ACC0YGH9_9ROSI|nr:hypothetical protein Pint_25566 [Pistacia integerrima]